MEWQIIEPEEWPAIRDSMPPTEYTWQTLIPARAKTFIHGPPGAGKSGLLYTLGNAMRSGETFLGLPTKTSTGLLISADMTKPELKSRWENTFLPGFTFCPVTPFNCTQSGFREHPFYKAIQERIKRREIDVVMIDSLYNITLGRKLVDDNLPSEVYGILQEWFGEDRTLIILGHDKKTRYDNKGKPLPPGKDDFLGSQLWRAGCTSQVHIWPIGQHISTIQHDKNQVGPKLEYQIQVYVGECGLLEPFDEHKFASNREKMHAAYLKLASTLKGKNITQQNEILAAYFGGVHTRTIERWRADASDKP